MGLSTGDGFRFFNGGFLSRVFVRALVINACFAFGRAVYQEVQEDQGQVPKDGMNIAVDTLENFAWSNPRDALLWTIDRFSEPE